MVEGGWLVLPDRPEASTALACQRHDVLRHPSGRPWLVGAFDRDELTLASVGSLRVAVIGTCPVTATRLGEFIAHVRTLTELDAVARALPGSWHLVASLDGTVRAQGSLAGLRRVFHTPLHGVGGVTVAGDRADSLAALAGAGLDERALAVRVACAGQLPPPLGEHSYWRGVHALAPDHYLRLDPAGVATEVHWWHPPEPERTRAAGAGAVRDALEVAVAARRPSTGRLSADLSGGLDSTSLCLLAADTVTPKLLSFRWAEADTANDDAVFAAHAAAALPQAEHLVIAQADLPAKFADPGELGDTEAPYPFSRTLARTRHDTALLHARGSRVHLAGHGGDELFHGPAAYLHTLLRRRPLTAIARVRAHRALSRWSWPATCSALASRADTATWWRTQAQRLTDSPPPRRTPYLDWGYPLRAPQWVTPAACDTARAILRATAETARPLATDRGQHSTLTALRTTGPRYRQLARQYATTGPRLELPYLDDRVIETALAVRLDERITPWRLKPLLIDAMHDVLPAPIAARTTKGEFGEDVRVGLRRHLPDILAVFADSTLATHGLIDTDRLRRALLAPHVDWTAMFAMEDLLGCETWLRAVHAPPIPPLARRTHATPVTP
jgi:asparagine synthase (glutamine-hydrolysing)